MGILFGLINSLCLPEPSALQYFLIENIFYTSSMVAIHSWQLFAHSSRRKTHLKLRNIDERYTVNWGGSGQTE